MDTLRVDGSVRVRARVECVVQGVGFRPFVYALAGEYALAGLVGNDVQGVFLEVEGPPAAVTGFLGALRTKAPPLAEIEQVTVDDIVPTGVSGFVIVASDAAGRRNTLVAADSATCADCLAELFDPNDRRFGYPFVNCTNCGPRFTIVRDVPYDRPYTTMSGFPMCADCATEYHDPADRRFHAQPTCCPVCGPRLWLAGSDDSDIGGTDPIAAAAAMLRAGRVLAIKGLGGYHLAAAADNQQAVAALRSRKHRADKPFALMVSDVDEARTLCDVDEVAEEALTGRRRPIVLLPRLPSSDAAPHAGRSSDAALADAVAPGNRELGVMLPYTPLHHLLLLAVGGPIVLTSGNVSDEPIAYRDTDAADRLAGIADGFLRHDRAIHIRTDDSVVRPRRGRPVLLRRSRGYVPEPFTLRQELRRPVLGCGAELKNTFCLATGRHAFLSHHIGDLENAETLRSFTEGVAHFGRLFDITPQIIAHDLHPEYLSTKYAVDQEDVDLVGVQHHHAHIASCLADNGVAETVIGVAFDGTGYGPDGTIWGGEFLVADLATYRRGGHLATVPMPGGATAIRQPWRMAAAYLDAAGVTPHRLEVFRRNESRWSAVVSLARSTLAVPRTSSAGRLFDAVAALLGMRDEINYEGQAAIELEQRADRHEGGCYPVAVDERAGVFELAGVDLIRAAAADLVAGVPVPVIAGRFHNGVVAAIVGVCERIAEATGVRTVALSGGVFQNQLLADGVEEGLAAHGFRVLTHGAVPCNDGGISLGQVAVAGALDRAGSA
jgi:hydrogenase maturation protein HypF